MRTQYESIVLLDVSLIFCYLSSTRPPMANFQNGRLTIYDNFIYLLHRALHTCGDPL